MAKVSSIHLWTVAKAVSEDLKGTIATVETSNPIFATMNGKEIGIFSAIDTNKIYDYEYDEESGDSEIANPLEINTHVLLDRKSVV